MDEKLPELQPRVSHTCSFNIKIVSRKVLLKVLASPQTHFRSNFSVSKSCSVYEISQYFFSDLKLYLLSIHMANNLILAISFGFKLNSNLKLSNILVPAPFLPSFLHLLLSSFFAPFAPCACGLLLLKISTHRTTDQTKFFIQKGNIYYTLRTQNLKVQLISLALASCDV